MNERIRKLAEQAGIIPGIMGVNRFTHFDPEKFAQLIVQECIQLCQECIDDGCAEAQEPMGKIKEHFRVEE